MSTVVATDGLVEHYLAPTSWDGSSTYVRDYQTVTIWCTVAPSVAATIQTSPDGNVYLNENALTNTGAITNTISTASPAWYRVPAGAYIKLTGGTGGTYFISGGQ